MVAYSQYPTYAEYLASFEAEYYDAYLAAREANVEEQSLIQKLIQTCASPRGEADVKSSLSNSHQYF